MTLPDGARKIFDARVQGFSPAHPIVVSFMNQRMDCDPVVYADATKNYSWMFLKGLECVVYADSRIADLDRHLTAIAKMAKCPVEVFYVDADSGHSCWWSPNSDSVDAALEGKIPMAKIRWELDKTAMLGFMAREYKRYYEECTGGTHPRFD